ncbi:MAG TPA: Tim44-like domain-containing protein [Burkholderiaceae bacterium]|nr:Tim44-like domain-containing protein [Burkholderiaceae bacterium]
MKTFSMMAAVLTLGLALISADAEAAKRLGGGKSVGTQRQAQVDKSPNATPAQTPGTPAGAAAPAQSAAAAAPAAAAAAAKPKSSWMGPLAGIAAGLGLAALASHFGFGEELATMLMIGLAVMLVLGIIGFVMRKRAMAAQGGAARAGGMEYAAAGANPTAQPTRGYDVSMPAGGSGSTGGSMIGANLNSPTNHIPADFDTATFERQAKVQFIRLQASNDAKNLDDIRDFTTPEMFAELKMDILDRGQTTSKTEVLTLDATVIDVAEEGDNHVVTVRFNGTVRDVADPAPEAFDELWHLVKPRQGNGGWVLAGIQQV